MVILPLLEKRGTDMKTFVAKKEDIKTSWYVIDAKGKTLGRVAAAVAKVLRGKGKVIFTPSVDTGDHVVIINASLVRVTGNKLKDKSYSRYSGYPGGIKNVTLENMLKNRPEAVIRHAVRGMIPHNRLGRDIYRKLKVYSGETYPHKPQNPIELTLN